MRNFGLEIAYLLFLLLALQKKKHFAKIFCHVYFLFCIYVILCVTPRVGLILYLKSKNIGAAINVIYIFHSTFDDYLQKNLAKVK